MFGDTRLPDAFWENVIPEPNTGCWLWLGSVAGNGFARLKIAGNWRHAHQVAHHVLNGTSDRYSRRVFHTCSEKTCCNPGHLFSYERITPGRRTEYKVNWQRAALIARPELRERRNSNQRRAYAQNPERGIEHARRWQNENRDLVRAMGKRWRENNPDKVKKQSKAARFRRYGISEQDFNAMLERQSGNCAVCNVDLESCSTKDVHIDHCHKTGKVRGLLCGKCNLGIGHFDDDTDRMRAAAEYIERSRLP